MKYIIDVIKTSNIEVFKAHWLTNIKDNQKLFNFNAELFVKIKDIRDSSFYNVISLISFSDHDLTKTLPLATNLDLCEYTYRTVCEQKIMLSGKMNDAKESIYLINPFEINKQQVDEVLDMWDKAKDFMIDQAGFVDARLFSSLSESNYNLINVAQWSNADLFLQALNSNSYDAHRQKSLNYKLHPCLCKREYRLICKEDL